MKVIFLDFDGVISIPEKGWTLDIVKLKLLKKIVDATDAKIVVTSSWKVGCRSVEEFVEKTFDRRMGKNVEQDKLTWFINSIVGLTDSHGNARGDEIKRWLDNHSVNNYVILDDDSDMLDEQLFHFVQTDSFEGITEREVKLCIAVLNDDLIHNPIRLNLVLITRWRIKCLGIDWPENNIDKLMLEYRYNRSQKE